MRPNENNPTLWFAWYPVCTDYGPRWLTEVWWWVEPTYLGNRYRNHYGAR